MDGKIFSFDLQRFNEVWSVSGGTYVYGTESAGAITGDPLATLKVAGDDSAKFWSLGGGSADTPITLDLSQTTGANSVVGEILDSMTGGKHWTLDASKVTGGFSFKLVSSTPFTSIQGGNSGISIDAALSTVNDLYLGGGSSKDLLVASKGRTTLDGGAGDDTLKGNAGVDTFVYKAGKDVIQSYTYGSDDVRLNGSFTFPTTFGDSMNYAGKDYSVSLGTDNVLTFESTQQFALIKGNDTYTYTPRSIAKNNKDEHAITIGGDYYTSKTFNGASEDNSAFVSINASQVKHAIRVTGNDKPNYIVASSLGGGTLLGGDGDDTLVAGSVGTYMDGGDGNVLYKGSTEQTNSIGADTFVYRGNTASIQGYSNFDVVSFSASDLTITDATVSTASVGSNNTNISLNWGGNDAIIFQSLSSSDIVEAGVSLKSGRNNLYVYKKDSVTWNDKSITLTSARTEADFNGADTELTTVDASQVTATGMSIVGNTLDNYIIGSASKANTLYGGEGNDTLVGNAKAGDIFQYTAGNDVIVDFNNSDKFSIAEDLQGSIKSGKAGRNNLTFKIDKDNSIVFRADEEDVQTGISLDGAGGGLLTANGVVNGITSGDDNGKYSLKLFSGAKGTIDLTDTNIYGNLKITSINASAVEKQGLTIVAKSVEGSAYYDFFPTNKKRDTFEYNGGAVSITGFESGKDRLNIVDNTITSFSISGSGTDGDVIISLNSGSSDVISLNGAQGKEILVRANGARGYSKMVFRDPGVLENKTKNPTSVTLAANATGYEAGKTVKKITVKDIKEAISIQAGDSGSVIDASEATEGVSLYSGAKSDRFTGSSGHSDIFFYDTAAGGKDIFNAFVASGNADSISFTNGASVLGGAKITASKNAVKFKFDSKNVLAVKGDSIKDATLQIDGTAYSYGKNAIIDGDHVSLTSQFGGTYKISGGVNYVDGSKATKNLTYKSASSGTNEILFGGTKKTTFKTSGGTDSLVGGSGDDVFFYAKGDTGTATIADFDFKNDKLKIAGGTIRKIASISGGGVSFNMSVRNRTDDPEIGHFNIKSYASYTKDGKDGGNSGTLNEAASKEVLIHANNTYYWFAQSDFTETVTTAGSSEGETIAIHAGDLITSNKHKPKSSDLQSYKVVELNYSTNLVKSGAAVLVSNEKGSLPSATT